MLSLSQGPLRVGVFQNWSGKAWGWDDRESIESKEKRTLKAVAGLHRGWPGVLEGAGVGGGHTERGVIAARGQRAGGDVGGQEEGRKLGGKGERRRRGA